MSDCKVLWTQTARGDLNEIIHFIAEDNPINALSVLDRIEQRSALLAVQPERGRFVPELREERIRQYRELQEKGIGKGIGNPIARGPVSPSPMWLSIPSPSKIPENFYPLTPL